MAQPNDTPTCRPGRLVNNGAYLLSAWRLSDRIRLTKNPHYWDSANVQMNTVDMLPMAFRVDWAARLRRGADS